MAGDMSSYDPTMPAGSSQWQPPPGYAGNQGNQDPFAYTGGTLLTPWTGQFNPSGYGGVVTPQFTPFQFGQFNYAQPNVGNFGETYSDPAAFRFADFNGPSAFKAPTTDQMKQDPGYQARMDAMQKATTAAAAHSGALRTGGFARDMASKMGDLASQEYANTYNRAQQTWNTNWGQAKDVYGINQGNTKQAFDTNTANRLAAHQQRAQDWSMNANTGLQQAQLGYNIASGAWDRNEQLGMFQNQQQNQYNQMAAAAQSQNNQLAYQRDLAAYQLAQNTFYTNQDRQYNMLSQQQQMGLGATNNYAGDLMSAYGAYGNAGMAGANAAGAGQMAGANAWGGFAQGMGNMIGGLAMYQGQQPPSNYGGGTFSQFTPGGLQGYTGQYGGGGANAYNPGINMSMPPRANPRMQSSPFAGFIQSPQGQNYGHP